MARTGSRRGNAAGHRRSQRPRARLNVETRERHRPMLRAPEPVLMIMADISGYTSYLTGTEIDHAQNVLEDLLETVYGKLAPPFTMVKAEGDALFLFAPGGQISGGMLLDTIDACYFAFRRRLRD